jgi:ATP-dependent exoDNAse (exonuclease V) alpha subunit
VGLDLSQSHTASCCGFCIITGVSYTLSQDQAAALRQIGAWYRSKSAPFLTLGGYAGTGKTTLIAYLRRALRDYDERASVAFCAYTGKAARVLQDRLRAHRVMVRGDSVGTIHSLIYTTEEGPAGVPRWVRKDKLERDLIVVDEASMVDEAIWRDLLAFGVPVLAVGDHGQLPPVGSSFNLMESPRVRLDRIFRQEAGSPIIEVATLARETGYIPVREFGPGVRKLDRSLPETGVMTQELLDSWRPDLLILCGYNATRVKLNAAIRGLRDMESPEPQSGDVVVCLRNNRAKHIFNGMIGRVVRVVPALGEDGARWYEAEIALEGEDYSYTGYIWREQFGAATTARDVPLAPDGERGDLWDFGYALTVHKAQGSQARAVLVFEERFARSDEADWRRWLYTAVTRAQLELTIVGPA